ALEVFSQAALGVGRLERVEAHEIAETPAACSDWGAEALDVGFLPKGSGSRRARANGWSLHAGTTVARGDRGALERLLRYFTRPPLAQARLFLLHDGRIAYELRKPWRRDQTHRIMTPLELMARLAALIPPPRAPLLRFHGCF